MKIILVISNQGGKNILFILDNLQAYTLEETIKKVKRGKISGVHVVEATNGAYVRANPNSSLKDNLDSLSISINALTRNQPKEKNQALKEYFLKRKQFLKEREKQGEKVIYIDGKRKKTKKEVINYLSEYKNHIRSAAKDLNVDQNLLGAILIDEYLRKDLADNWFDWLAILGRDTSVGPAQVKISTARELIRKRFYNPCPSNKAFSPKNANKLPAVLLCTFLYNPKHSIYFACAKMNQIKNDDPSRYDITKPEIIGDLYSGTRPHSSGEASNRGKQIASEFYQIAKEVLKL